MNISSFVDPYSTIPSENVTNKTQETATDKKTESLGAQFFASLKSEDATPAPLTRVPAFRYSEQEWSDIMSKKE